MERIFEPYERADSASELPSGVGIGLFVSRLLARLMGGDLECVRDDGWTEFRLWLPAPDRAPDWAVSGEPVAVRYRR